MKICVFSTIAFICWNCHFLKAQDPNNASCGTVAIDILALLYNNEIKKAQDLKDKFCSEQTLESTLLQAHILRWQHLPIYDKEASVSNVYIQSLQAIAEKEPLSSEYQSFIQLNALLLLAEFYYNSNETIMAAKYGGKAYNLIKPKLEQTELTDEWLLVAGLYNYFYSYYLNKNLAYHSLLLFFKTGDKKEGLKQLSEAAGSNTIVQAESLIYLSHIYLRLENNSDKSLLFSKKLINNFPENLKFYEFYIEAAIAGKHVDGEVRHLIEKLKRSDEIYYQKYGRTYEAIVQSTPKKTEKIHAAIVFLERNGGGNHLLSLLYKKLAELSENREEATKKLNAFKVYDYELTRL